MPTPRKRTTGTRVSKTVEENEPKIEAPSPLVFISHDTRDADLAEAFGNLLTDASGGILHSFRSSDRKGTAGIEFGAEWYAAIMSKLSDASDVVALLTSHSLERPWILYEAGVAKGKLDTTVLGLAINIPLDRTNSGPFAQFQNCADDEDSLTKLVLQLIRRNPQAQPREEAVRRQVQAFQNSIKELSEKRTKTAPINQREDENAVAKMFEEIKILMRDLPTRIGGNSFPEASIRSRLYKRKFHPEMMDRFFYRCVERETHDETVVGLYMVFSIFRDDVPWFYSLGMDLIEAIKSGSPAKMQKAHKSLRLGVDLSRRAEIFSAAKINGFDEEILHFIMHQITDVTHRLISEARNQKGHTKIPPPE